jgi:Ca2+/Na+ antiporter
MTGTTPGLFDPKTHELAEHLRSDLLHALLGLISLALSVMLHFEIGEWLSLTYVGASLLFTVYRYRQRKQRNKALEATRSNYLPVRAAWPGDFNLIEDIDRGWLGADRNAVIPARVFANWADVDPTCFWVHVDANNQVRGYYSILNVKPERFEMFKQGKIDEPQFRQKDLLPPARDLAAEELYFFSIAYREGADSKNVKHVLVRHAADKIAYLQNFGRLQRLYAAAASPAGGELIKSLPFRLVMKGTHRKDRHDLYVLDLTSHDTREIVSKLGRRGARGTGHRAR